MEESFESLGTKVIFAKNFQALSYFIGVYGNDVLWVVDENTAKMVRPIPEPYVLLESGEKNKNLKSILKILQTATKGLKSRHTTFVAFGGGVICDLTAFAASVYMRGSRLVLVPTTLLSMVDASLGGKTGFDYENGKNLIGTFYPANEVIICSDTLKSLNEFEYKNGLAEVLKHALLSSNDELYNFLVENKEKILARDTEVLNHMIYLSLQVKNDFISKDPKETKGIRQALNLGHTFGHALESHTRLLSWSHGEAVAWGIGRAIEAGVKIGITKPDFAYGVKKLFHFFGFDFSFRLERDEWQDYKLQLLKDKKRNHDQIYFVLLSEQGKYVLEPLDFDLVKDCVIKKAIN